MNSSRIRTIKCVTVGDGNVGKSCMLASFANNQFPEDYIPTVFDNFEVNTVLSGITVSLLLHDTAGQAEYSRLRRLSYPNTDVFLICFSLIERASFDNIDKGWLAEIREHCPVTPIILVGTKMDRREELEALEDCSPALYITHKEGLAKAKAIKAKHYIECSAKKQKNLTEVFEHVVRIYMAPPEERSCCSII